MLVFLTPLLTIFIICLYIAPTLKRIVKERLAQYKQNRRKLIRPKLFNSTPSGALIDQLLPPEILSTNIIGSQDILFLRKCRQVSKYWSGVAATISRQHFFHHLPARPVELETKGLRLHWLEYPTEWYDIQWLYEDAVLAQEKGLKMIDIDQSSITDAIRLWRQREVQWKRILVKIRGTFQRSGMLCSFIGNDRILFNVDYNRSLPDSGVVEIITDLHNFDAATTVLYDRHIYTLRELPIEGPIRRMSQHAGSAGNEMSFLGILPSGRTLLQMLYYAYMPVLASDIIQLLYMSPYYSLALQVTGIAVLTSMILLVLGYTISNYPLNHEAVIIIYLIFGIIGVVLAWFIESTGWFTDFTNLSAFCIAATSYQYLFDQGISYFGSLHGLHAKSEWIRTFYFALVILTVNWYAAIRSIFNGSIWPYLLRSIVYASALSAFYLFSQLIRFRRVGEIGNSGLTWSLVKILYGLSVFYSMYLPARYV